MTEPLFTEELDGITALTAHQARDWHEQMLQAREEIRAESGWLREGEHNYFTPQEGGY